MIGDLLKSKCINRALTQLNELCIAVWDFTIHEPESHDAIEDMNISATYNRLKREIFPLDGPWQLGGGDEWGHPYTCWTSIACGDYHAGYYGYLLYG